MAEGGISVASVPPAATTPAAAPLDPALVSLIDVSIVAGGAGDPDSFFVASHVEADTRAFLEGLRGVRAVERVDG